MTNETNLNEVVETVEEAAKPKRTRKAPVKVQKTAVEIIAELNELGDEVTQLADALSALEVNTVVHDLVNAELEKKQDELAKAQTTVYTI